jgi:hypothetical protein
VSGSVGPMTTSGTTQAFYYSLSGVDPACSSGAGSAGNSCGIHIHSGTTCTGDAGGHFYTGSVTSDPWTSIAYTSTSGVTSGSVNVDTGALSSSLVGKAMIIHAYDGSRIACALLSDGVSSALSSGAFVPYFSYSGSRLVSGSVGPMTTSVTTQTFYYSLSGIDPACAAGAGRMGNSCGIHIHSGTTCTADAGGHFYTGSVTSDPWTTIAYTSSASGMTSDSVTVDTGATSDQVAGRAMIIHAYDGSRIGCAILGAATQLTLTAAGFVPYFSYTGAMAVSGSVGPMTTSGTTQAFYYSLSGVDPACSLGAGSAGNSCGIHIHSGTTCTADAGGHFYTGSVTSDPWTSIAYTSTSGVTSGSVNVDTGALSSSLVGKAMIIHAYDGSRIACALLSTSALPPPPSPPSSPPPPSPACTSSASPVCAGAAEPCVLDAACASGGVGCNAGGLAQTCRFCGFDAFVPCPGMPSVQVTIPATVGAEGMCPQACTGNPAETCVFDATCASSGDFGCNAGGRANCRFCGFGSYAPCPSDSVAAVTLLNETLAAAQAVYDNLPSNLRTSETLAQATAKHCVDVRASMFTNRTITSAHPHLS